MDFFAGHYTWAKLFRLLGQLPWHSRYQLAIADDDEYQARILEVEQDDDAAGPATPGRTRPPLRSWDQHEDLRATLVDGFNSLLAAQAGKKGKKPKPTPRPETGRDRAKRARDAATVSELFEAFTPGR